MASQFPSQSVPESEKNKPNGSWGKAHLDYAESLLIMKNNMFSSMSRLYQSYNGEKFTNSWFKTFSQTAGKDNKAKMISYRWSRNKLDLLNGEYLKRPIKGTVETVNSESKTAKLEQAYFMKGAMAAQQEGILDKLKEVGVDVTEGMQIPKDENDPIWERMSFKDKNEEIMQIILNNAVKELGIQWKTAKNFLDCEIVSGCYGKVDITDEGKLDYIIFDPRDAIYVEIENDPFLERSPLKGARHRKTLSEVLARYPLNKEQIKVVENAQNNVTSYVNGKKFNTYLWKGGDLCVDVIHVEWRSVKPEYFKLSPKTQKQMMLDPSTTYYTLPLGVDVYESNPEKYFLIEVGEKTNWNDIFKDVPNNKVAVIRKYKEDIWEATRIAGCMDVQVRRKYFQLRKHDSKAYILDLSYCGFNFQTVDGLRISLQESLGNFDNILDIIMYQILKELNSAKGRALFIDRGLLGAKQTVKQIVYDVVNDGFTTVDSTQDGANLNGMDITKLIHQVDLGFSSNLQSLFQLKDQMLGMMDRISGVNENREGFTPASSTATNATNSIAASRTITEPLFYHFSLYVEKLLMKICEAYKVTYAFYEIEKGKQILGDNKQGFLEVLNSIGYQDYGVSLSDGGRYTELKAKLENYVQLALNTKEITVLDAINAEVAETYAEMKTVFKSALERVQDIAAQQAQQDHEMQLQQQQVQQQSLQAANDAMQDKKTIHDIDKINAKGQAAIAKENQGALNRMHIDNNNAHNKIIENASKK